MTNYPQAPPMSKDEVETFLNSASIARLASHNPDGTIHIAPVWFLYEDGYIFIGTQRISRKARNVADDPRVTVVIDKQAPPFMGVVIYGHAELEQEDAVAQRVTIFTKYMDSKQATRTANQLAEAFAPVIIRIRPQQTISYDYAA